MLALNVNNVDTISIHNDAAEDNSSLSGHDEYMISSDKELESQRNTQGNLDLHPPL